MEENLVIKHTIVPLFGFEGPFFNDIDLGNNCFISKLPNGLLENCLQFGNMWDETGKTNWIDPGEKERFLTNNCIDHRYEGPRSPRDLPLEEESKTIVRRITQALQLIKFSMVSPEFIVQTVGDNYEVIGILKTNELNHPPESNSVVLKPFTDNEIETIKIMWPEINDVYRRHEQEFNRIANAFEFFRVGLNATAWQLRFVFFVISLESIYSTSNVEIAYSLSQRLAWFLASDSKERIDYFKKAKKIYNIRSQIIHGSRVERGLRKEALELIVDLEEMARQTLRKILVEKKLIGIFSNTDILKNYLDALTLS